MMSQVIIVISMIAVMWMPRGTPLSYGPQDFVSRPDRLQMARTFALPRWFFGFLRNTPTASTSAICTWADMASRWKASADKCCYVDPLHIL